MYLQRRTWSEGRFFQEKILFCHRNRNEFRCEICAVSKDKSSCDFSNMRLLKVRSPTYLLLLSSDAFLFSHSNLQEFCYPYRTTLALQLINLNKSRLTYLIRSIYAFFSLQKRIHFVNYYCYVPISEQHRIKHKYLLIKSHYNSNNNAKFTRLAIKTSMSVF